MKILIISQYWAPENGAPQRRWAWLSRELSKAGHDVLVVAPPPHYNRKMGFWDWIHVRGYCAQKHIEHGTYGERILRTGFIPAGASLTSRVLNQATVALAAITALTRPKLRTGWTPNVVIGTIPALPTAFVTRIVAWGFAVPYILDLRDPWPDLLESQREWNAAVGKKSWRERLVGHGPLQILSRLTAEMLNGALRHAKAILVTTDSLKSELLQREKIRGKKRASDFAVVRNVFPVAGVELVRDVKDSSSEALHVLYAGTIGRAQDIGTALEAINIAKTRGVTIQFRVVGAGAAKPEVVKIARDLGIDVEVFRRQKPDELNEHYAWADTALVSLASWDALRWAVPSKLYELMSMRMHISVVATGEAADLVRELHAGVAIPPAHPEKLAETWIALARGEIDKSVGFEAKTWVQRQTDLSKSNFLKVIGDNRL